ncbi:FAD-dependent oxidoreductase [Haloarculaceae archaeon H-GB2-1]|nr:FAD-dependent oxidoreductase [Haloarculaceae archaeon H-GB1-1]MEA5387808.1 FAD-dependent oxidoreductase [Haloarculaceae archaeon H-GB11]MEA5409307.1 FAD-dependent oxidoreductase [Haloarculaceae archaeon H-GB2-1]
MHVVVIGGGIVGLASAYELARRGVQVTLCEQGSLGNGSTDRAVGGIRTQFSTPVNVELSKASLDVWNDFEERFGTDIQFRRPGYLFLAREEETASALEASAAMQRDHDLPTETLSPADATEYCPGLEVDRYVAGSYSPLDGYADPHLAVQGYASGAREAGVDVRTGTTVTEVLTDEGAVRGVETDTERLDADFVVNAAGPWAGRVARMAGVDLPVSPRRRQVAIVSPSSPLSEDLPLTIDLDSGSYFRPERDGAAIVGGFFADDDPTVDPDGFDESMDLSWAAMAVERAGETATYFGPETQIKRGWAGLYGVTPDDHPIVEESVPGLVNAVGFSGHGFQHAPATGQVVAELCCDGSASLVDVSPLRSERFADGETTTERHVA